MRLSNPPRRNKRKGRKTRKGRYTEHEEGGRVVLRERDPGRRAPRHGAEFVTEFKRRGAAGAHEGRLAKKRRAREVPRKAKHRTRYNPDWITEEAYSDDVAKTRRGIRRSFSLIIGSLEDAGVPEGRLPEKVGDPTIGKAAQTAAEVIVASKHPVLRSDARLGEQPTALATDLFMAGPQGFFGAYAKEYPEVFEGPVADVAGQIKKGRAAVRRQDKQVGKIVKEGAAAREQARLDAREKQLLQEIAATRERLGEDVPSDILAEMAEEFGDIEREEESEARREEEPLVPQLQLLGDEDEDEDEEPYEYEEYEERPRTRVAPSVRAETRLGKYGQHRAKVRRGDVRPPLQVVADAREDILLYALQDGTTQVWAKGALTETFLPDKKTASWTIAHRYANRWRGLNVRGKLEPGAKKSRLRSRVLLAVEGDPGVKVIEESIATQVGKVTPKATQTHDLPDLDTYELKGDRANPRRRRNPYGYGDPLSRAEKDKFAALYRAKGKKVEIEGQKRTIVATRAAYGGGLELTLSSPLKGRRSTLYSIDLNSPQKAMKIRFLNPSPPRRKNPYTRSALIYQEVIEKPPFTPVYVESVLVTDGIDGWEEHVESWWYHEGKPKSLKGPFGSAAMARRRIQAARAKSNPRRRRR